MIGAERAKGIEMMRAAAMALCRAHRPCAVLRHGIDEDAREIIRSEERGEWIAAEMLEWAIAALQL